MKRAVIYLVCIPIDLVALLIFLALRVMYGGELRVQHGVLIFISKKDLPNISGITLGHAIAVDFGEDANVELFRHEHVHVRQFEGTALAGAALIVYLLALGLRWSVVPFAFLPWIHYYASSAAAWLGGRPLYRGNVLEEAARGIVDHPDGV